MTRWIGVVSVTFLTGLVAGVVCHRAFSAGEPGAPPELPRTVNTPVEQRAVLPREVNALQQERSGDASWVADLVTRLDRAAAERRQLEQEVAALHDKVQHLEARVVHPDTRGAQRTDDDPGVPPASAKEDAAADPATPLATRLTALGVDQDRAAEIVERVNEVDLDRLYLRDQATREGWLNTPRYAEEMRAINGDLTSLREDLGDADYDRYLFATGQPNRVVVRSVIPDSTAAEAGLQPGDTVVQYDGRRIFSSADVQTATAAGRAGEQVALTVVRGGERLQRYVPLGPLGIRFHVERRRPVGEP